MKILKIEVDNAVKDMIVVTVEGYPHVKHTVPIDTKPEDLNGLVGAWKVIQDAADLSNKDKQPHPATDITELKKLEGNEIIEIPK